MQARARPVAAPRAAGFTGVTDFLPGIYRAALDHSEWGPVLAGLGRRFGTRKAVFVTIDKVAGRAVALDLSGFGAGTADDPLPPRLTRFDVADDTVYQANRHLPADSTYVSSEIMTLEQLQASPLYDPLLGSEGLRYVFGGVIENDPHFYSAIGFWRSRLNTGPTSDDRHVLAALLPHLRVVVRVRRRLREAQAMQWASLYSMQFSRHGIILLNHRRTVMFANKEAERILRSDDGIVATNGELIFDGQPAWETLGPALDGGAQRASGSAQAGHNFRVSRRSLRLPYDVLVLARMNRAERIPVGAAWIVLISDPAEVFSIGRKTLVTHYGLTDAEARLCQALLRTGSLIKAARSLRISTNTARTHLKSIFAKLQVSSQVQLLQWLGSGIRAPSSEALDAALIAV